jgi:hypothetical protein
MKKNMNFSRRKDHQNFMVLQKKQLLASFHSYSFSGNVLEEIIISIKNHFSYVLILFSELLLIILEQNMEEMESISSKTGRMSLASLQSSDMRERFS